MTSSSNLIIELTTSDMSMKLLSYNRVRYMLDRGFTIRGLCSPGHFADALVQNGFPLDTIPMEREISPLKDIVSLFHLVRYFRKKRPHIVFSHTPKAGILGPVAARLAGVPHIVHVVHGLLVHDRAPFSWRVFGWLLEKHCAMWSDFCLSQSSEDCRRAVEYRISAQRRFRYLGNGIDVNAFDSTAVSSSAKAGVRSRLEIPPDIFCVGFVGRMVKEKGIREIVAAIPLVLKKIPRCHFLLIGPVEKDQLDGLPEDYMQRLTREYPVRWQGFLNEVKNMLAIMDVFVLPTYREGVPRALMEASAMECPCIATDVRGCREVVVHGKTGFLIAPRSHIALADAICRMHEISLVERKNMGTAARNHIVKKFNEQTVFKRFRRICDMLLQQ